MVMPVLAGITLSMSTEGDGGCSVVSHALPLWPLAITVSPSVVVVYVDPVISAYDLICLGLSCSGAGHKQSR
jgi:hypothetical protein